MGWKIKDGEVELTDNQPTLRTLLEELSRQTKLSEGDRVSIIKSIEMLGGG